MTESPINEALYLTRHGEAKNAFTLRRAPNPAPGRGEVRVKVEAFGLNFADVMARRGRYKDAPPLPSILGYEIVGVVDAVGPDVSDREVGERVLCFTRFGGYARYTLTKAVASVPLPAETDAGVALALATQYCTAYYAAEFMTRVRAGDHVLIQAAAGGVGIALVQIAKSKGAVIYGTAGSDEKIEFLKRQGVDYPINYRRDDFYTAVRKIRGKEGLDVVFDSLGGADFGKGFKLLGSGGRIVGFGAASTAAKGNRLLVGLQTVMGFGIYSPIELLMQSKSIIGVNMLRVADDRPDALADCMQEVLEKFQQGVFHPYVGARFKADEIGAAHALLENRGSIGKIIVVW